MQIEPTFLVALSISGIALMYAAKILYSHASFHYFTPKLYGEETSGGAPALGRNVAASAYFQRGLFLHGKGCFDLAVRDYERALALCPELNDARMFRAGALAREFPFPELHDDVPSAPVTADEDAVPKEGKAEGVAKQGKVVEEATSEKSLFPESVQKMLPEQPEESQGLADYGSEPALETKGEDEANRGDPVFTAEPVKESQEMYSPPSIEPSPAAREFPTPRTESEVPPGMDEGPLKYPYAELKAIPILSILAVQSDATETAEPASTEQVSDQDGVEAKTPLSMPDMVSSLQLEDQPDSLGLEAPDKDKAPSFLDMGRASHDKNDFAAAIKQYSQAIFCNPDLAKAYIQRGIAYSQLSCLDKALQDFSRAIAIQADNGVFYFLRGKLHLIQKQFDLAIADFSNAILYNPDYAEAYCKRGQARMLGNRLDEAIADFSTALNINEGYAEAYNNRGIAFSHLGKNKEARADFLQAAKLNPKLLGGHSSHADILYELAMKHVGEGRTKEALAALDKVVALSPRFFKACMDRGRLLLNNRFFDKAIADFSKAVEINPRSAEAFNMRGESFIKKNLYREAISDFQKAIELDPRYSAAHVNRGRANVQRGRHADALADFNSALEFGQANPDLLYLRAIERLNTGDSSGAMEDFKKGCELGQAAYLELEKLKKKDRQPLTPRAG